MKISRSKRCVASRGAFQALFLLGLVSGAATGSAQDFTQRGFLETRFTFYPQTAPGDSGKYIGEALLRYDATKRYFDNLRLNIGLDARTDTHRQIERDWFVNYSDRRAQRPAFSLRRASVSYTRGNLTLEAGKQFVRWGKADILNPTDRFAPRDFLNVIDTEFLPVTAARATWDNGKDSLDLVAQFRFTPSRAPLPNQRWTVVPDEIAQLPITNLGPQIPGGTQFGVRYNHIGRGYEASVSFYDGHNHLPIIDGGPILNPPSIGIFRVYPQMRMYGTDVAVPLRWFTVKSEAAYFTSNDSRADSYVLYVVQLERQFGEWSLVGGYAGEVVTDRRTDFNFAPDRGIARAFLGRAGYTIDVNRSIAVETAIRENGAGTWVRAEYSQAFGQHWRATISGNVIRGEPGDFLGQYRRNSNLVLAIRYSF
jgi:hypothetical protein